MRYNMVLSSEGNSTIVIIDGDNTKTITDGHPNFLRIVEGLNKGEDVTDWLNPSTKWFKDQYDEYDEDEDEDEDEYDDFDADTYIDRLSETINRYRREGRDPKGLLLFMDRLRENPSENSREQLFNWTQSHDLTIDIEGYIIGFKGVTDEMLSVHSGTAFVDGIEHVGRIPNPVGTVVSMPREMVQDNPSVGCSTGLHVGTWDYARNWGSVLLEVRVNPADVVSVPNDSAHQKLRTCRYTVVAVHETDTDDLDGYEPDATWDEDEAMDSFMDYVPPTFMDRLRNKLTRKGR